jgi:HD-like signal output (HDOD) protein
MNSEKVNADHKALYDAAIRKLPAGIVNYSSVLAALDDPLSSDADIEHLIKGDPVLAAKVLRLANGA